MNFKYVIFILILPIILFAQDTVVDSLKNNIKTLDGKEKINNILSLANYLITVDIEEAQKHTEEARQLSEEINYQKGIANSWNIIGNISYRKGDYNEAIEIYKKAEEFYKVYDDQSGISKVYNNLGLIYSYLGNYEEAEDYYLKSLSIKKSLKDLNGISSCYTNLGLMHWQMNEYVTAIDYLKKSLEIQKDVGSKSTIANTFNNLALAYYNINEMDTALEYLFKTLDMGNELNNQILVASSLNNIGSVYSDMNLHNDAIEYHQKALEVFKKLENKPNIANTYNNIGLTYKFLEDLENASANLEKAIAIFHEIEDIKNIVNASTNLADVFFEQKQFDKAIKYAEESLKLSRAKELTPQIISNLNLLGKIYLEQDDLTASENMLLESKQIIDKSHDNKIASNNIHLLAQLYARKSQFKKAYDFLKKYLSLHDSLITQQNMDELNELKIKYDLQSKENENELLKKDIELIKLRSRGLIFGLIAAALIIALIAVLLVNRVKINRKLHRINNDLDAAKQEAEKSEKQISLINKMLRHDITNNLSVVISALKLFKEDNDLCYIEEANRKCFAGIELIKNLQSMEKQKIDFAHRHPVQLENLLGKNIKKYPQLNISYQGTANVLADETIESVFLNLIENALKHGKADKIEISILEVNNICEIRVFNNGKHIGEKIKTKIFDENFSYGDSGNTGMGLYLLKQNIERYGGSIYVENTEPEGVTFVLNLKKA